MYKLHIGPCLSPQLPLSLFCRSMRGHDDGDSENGYGMAGTACFNTGQVSDHPGKKASSSTPYPNFFLKNYPTPKFLEYYQVVILSCFLFLKGIV